MLLSGAAQSSTTSEIDIYYYSSSDGTTFLVQSANANDNTKRETFFKISNSSDLEDGVDSPAQDNTWGHSMSDTETNYVFLYDEDGHYSKLKIATFHAGTGPGDPSYVEVVWYYNPVAGNKMF